MSNHLQAIIWDVDGTLVNSHDLCIESTNKVLQKYLGPDAFVTEHDYHQASRFTTITRMAWHYSGNPDDEMGPTLAQEFNDLYISLLDTNTAPLYENIKDIFDYLSSKQIKMGLLSNASLDYVVKVRTTHEMEHLFPSYHGADSVPKPKPHGDGILHVLKELEIEHEAYHKNTSTPCVCSKIVYIGDSPSDGKAAKAANVLSIGVSWGSHPLENIQDHFDYIVNTPIELLDLLTKINENGHE